MSRVFASSLALMAGCFALLLQTPAFAGTATPATALATATIKGRVTDQSTGKPVEGVYITVGYKGIKLAAITGPDGRYTVPRVPAGQPADVFGFHGGGYRYHNSRYDDHLRIELQPGQVLTYNFTVRPLNDPAGEPRVTDPALTPDQGKPGQRITFAVTAQGGKGGLSDEIMAASPKLGRLVLLTSAGGNRFQGTLVIPAGTAAGDYPFAFFAASNDCYDNHVFPVLTLRVR